MRRVAMWMAGVCLAGLVGAPGLLADEEGRPPNEKPAVLKEKPDRPPVFREKEGPREWAPPEKPPRPDLPPPEAHEGRPPREKHWEKPDRPFRPEHPDRPERGEREPRPTWREGRPDRPREEGPRRPILEPLARPPVAPREGPPGPLMAHRPDWERLQRTDPEMFRLLRADEELEEQSHRLAMLYRRAPEREKEALRRELEEVVTRHFEIRQERRLLELRRLEEELHRLRESIERRRAHREEIIHRRIQELIGPEDLLRF